MREFYWLCLALVCFHTYCPVFSACNITLDTFPVMVFFIACYIFAIPGIWGELSSHFHLFYLPNIADSVLKLLKQRQRECKNRRVAQKRNRRGYCKGFSADEGERNQINVKEAN